MLINLTKVITGENRERGKQGEGKTGRGAVKKRDSFESPTRQDIWEVNAYE